MKLIKKLEIEELKTVYKKYIRNDFPRSERRPFSSMEKLTREERYASYGYFDGDRLTAYACYILTGDSQFALLDYFAVIPELRDCGIGSSFLKALREHVPVGVGAFAEAESPADAKSDTEKTLRERRIRFYVTNGAVLTDMKCLLFGVNYDILFLAAGDLKPAPEQLQNGLENLYREIYRPVYGKLCKPYRQTEERR